jgi:hypothetical protein
LLNHLPWRPIKAGAHAKMTIFKLTGPPAYHDPHRKTAEVSRLTRSLHAGR